MHQKPRGHVADTMRVVATCCGAVEVTVIVVPSAAPSAVPSAASSTILTAVRSSATGTLTGVPSGAVDDVAIVSVNVSPLLCKAR